MPVGAILVSAFALSTLSAGAPLMLAPVPPEGAAFLHSFEGRWGVVKLVPADPSFSQEFDGYAMRCGGPKEWNITIRPEAQDDGVKDWTFRYVPEADGYSYVESLDERRSRMTTWLFGRETFERHGDRLMVTNWIGKITLRRCTH